MAMGRLIKAHLISCMRVTLLHYCFFASLLLALRVKNIDTDKEALLALKLHITSDSQNLLETNWNNSTTVCNWVGITCGSRHHRIIALDISHMGLTGTIPPHLGNLSFLVSISFSNNSFHGFLPNELSLLRRIKHFSFSRNYLSGEIPSWIGSFTRLERLGLHFNNFTGIIPASLCNLSNLNHLSLYSNDLQGYIPQDIGNLYKLRILYLDHNRLSGSIPFSIFNLSSLQQIDLSDNWLSGSIFVNNMSTTLLKELDFGTNNLTGRLPVHMFSHLPNLEGLYLSENLFYGPIPSTLFLCNQLKALSLSFNDFQGSIHSDIQNLTRLQYLYLGWNNFSGSEIPTSIGNVVDLEELGLTRSGLSGFIPSTIGNLTFLRMLDLGENALIGKIPYEIGNLANLEKLYMGMNRLAGFVPSGIFNASNLISVELVDNHLSGHLPSSLGAHLPYLQQLLLGGNEFNGSFPVSLSNASELIDIDLSLNSLFGPIPDTLGNLRNLQKLLLEENHLTTKSLPSGMSIFSSLTNCKDLRRLSVRENPLNGTLPISVGNLSSSLELFIASGCGITGTIPEVISNLSSLTLLNLGDNDLNGTIPPTVGKLMKLQVLSLQINRLEGSIPFELCELQNLAFLYLQVNKLFGSIPPCLGNVTSLRHLFMEKNKFTFTIPSTLWSLKNILLLNLSSNSLSGSLPHDIGNLKAVKVFDLSGNQLSGDITPSIGGLKDITHLSLSNNKLKGSIPQSLGDSISLEFLDLSNNSLSGEIPKSLEKLLNLKFFNVSFNQLHGEIPNGGSLTNFSFLSFIGNEGLCGAPKMQIQPCKTSIQRRSSKKSNALRNILLPIGSILLALAFAIVFLRYRKRKKRLPTQGPLLPLAILPRISIQELNHATDKFNEINLLGRGSFGSVYKGTLHNGLSVAVKVFNLQVEGAFKSFDVECEVLRKIRHRNLIKVITSCCNIDFKALVLEFMPNWSLDKWLYSHNYFLNILQRMNIMIDVASALEYLHFNHTTPIVHCDLKPSNILLDEDMVGHVSDFGIAKLFGEEHSIIQTMTLATVGYMAPEYGSEGLVSIKGDMYSYGILLMETFTRKKPTDEMFTEEMSMKQWVRDSLSLPCGITQIVDANLLMIDEQHFSAKKDCIESIILLAQKCCADLPEERIDIKDALSTLKKIKVKFLKDIGQT